MLSLKRQFFIHFALILMCKLFNAISKMSLTIKTIPPTGKTHSGTAIFFHGSGDTGSNLVEWIRFLLGKDLQFPHIKVIIPTAPVQPYTPLGGEMSHVWFDRQEISISCKESRKSLAAIYENVNDLIRLEVEQGIPVDRIVVGGFSMGGALGLHTGYHLNRNLAGVFACSSFLNNDSIIYESLRTIDSDERLPKLLMFHGDRDSLVPSEWGRRTFAQLEKLGVNGKFIPLKNTMHELKISEMVELQQWILDIVPPLDTDLANKL